MRKQRAQLSKKSFQVGMTERALTRDVQFEFVLLNRGCLGK